MLLCHAVSKEIINKINLVVNVSAYNAKTTLLDILQQKQQQWVLHKQRSKDSHLGWE